MTRPIEIGLGVAIFVVLIGGLVLALRRPVEEDLYVRIEGPKAFVEIGEKPDDVLEVGPRELLPRVEEIDDLGSSAIELVGHRVLYGKRWEREVTVPRLATRALPEGTPWPCAIKIRLLPSFLDDGVPGAGGDAIEIVDREIRKQFPRYIDAAGVRVMSFAKVRSTELSVHLERDRIVATGKAILDDDDDDPTTFEFKGKIALDEDDGDLVVGLKDFELDWSGRTRRKLLVQVADIFADVEGIAELVVEAQIKKVLPFIKLPKKPVRLEALALGEKGRGPKGPVWLRLCGDPEISADGVDVPIGATIDLEGTPIDASIPGPLALPRKAPALVFSKPRARDTRKQPHNIEAVASAEALQQTLYLLWQGGALADWGQRDDVLAAFRSAMDDRLTLQLDGLDVRLPPSNISGVEGCEAFAVRFADVALGTIADGRKVLAHADLCAAPAVREGRLELEARILRVAANCVEEDGGDLLLTPCLSDVIPVLRGEDLSRYPIPLSLPIPERFLHVSLVREAALTVQDLTAETDRGLLQMRARAILSHEPKEADEDAD